MDWNVLAAVTAALGTVAATWQIWRVQIDALDTRAAEIASVALVTTLVERPTEASNRAGRGLWVYRFEVHNPGRLPISDVRATVTFPFDVERQHYDGTLDKPTRTLDLRTPVIAPGGTHTRHRSLLIGEDNRPRADNTKAAITFRTPDAGEHTTYWPPAPTKGSSSIRRRLSGPRR